MEFVDEFKFVNESSNWVDWFVNLPEASFIPEIWQGHKNSGSGFWYALEQLEKDNIL